MNNTFQLVGKKIVEANLLLAEEEDEDQRPTMQIQLDDGRFIHLTPEETEVLSYK